jgi:hypothetical protein
MPSLMTPGSALVGTLTDSARVENQRQLTVLKFFKAAYAASALFLFHWAWIASVGGPTNVLFGWDSIASRDDFRTLALIFFTLLLTVLFRDGTSLIRGLFLGTAAFVSVPLRLIIDALSPALSEGFLSLLLLISIGAVVWETRAGATRESSQCDCG